MPLLGGQVGQGTAGGTDITSALKGITLQLAALVKAIPIFFNSIISKANTLYVSLAGSTMTGPLILSGDPTLALGAATMRYAVAKAGDTMTGALILSADPTSSSPPQQAATKNYVDVNNAAIGGVLVAVNIYSSSGTITVPAATAALVQMWGATGGSGGGNGGWTAGSGAGGYLEKYFTGLTSGSTMVYTQGAAGTAGTTAPTSGGDGGVTTLVVGTLTLTCNGSTGTVGNSGSAGNTGGAGGTASGGDLNITGQSGGSSFPSSVAPTAFIAIGGSNFFSKGANGVGGHVAGNPGNPGGLKITWYS